MLSTVTDKATALAELCRRNEVDSLYLFGSATADVGQPNDLDFLVSFQPGETASHFERYFGLLEGLRELYDKPVDLVEECAMRNPYFIKEVLATRVKVYGEDK